MLTDGRYPKQVKMKTMAFSLPICSSVHRVTSAEVGQQQRKSLQTQEYRLRILRFQLHIILLDSALMWSALLAGFRQRSQAVQGGRSQGGRVQGAWVLSLVGWTWKPSYRPASVPGRQVSTPTHLPMTALCAPRLPFALHACPLSLTAGLHAP